MVLRQVLEALESVQGPVNLDDLSRRLGVERSALEGMINFWLRKGRLREDYLAARPSVCASGTCGGSCPGASSCSPLNEMPRFFLYISHDNS
jgi:hypothetical protein